MTVTTQLQLRRGTATQVAAFTPAQGEAVVDTTNNRVVIGDGTTVGGWPVARLADLPVVSRTAVADANYTALTSDRNIAYSSISAARTVSLPTAASFPVGVQLTVLDESGSVTSSNAITLSASGTDRIDGAATAVINAAYGYLAIESNGSGKWTIVDQNASSCWTNRRLAKTAAYTVAAADIGYTIALGGSAFYTLTFSAASGYAGNFAVVVLNEDSGRAKTIACSGLSSFLLWPGQSCVVFNQNNVWRVNPSFQRWKVPNNTTIYIDCNAGLSTNDGLASGSGGALDSFNTAIRVLLKDYFDLSGTSSYPTSCITFQLADNASAGVPTANAYSLCHMAFGPVGGEGRCMVLIQGNATTPSNVVVSDSGGTAIAAFGLVELTLANFQIGQTGSGSPVANSGISASDGALIWLQTGMIIGKCTAQQFYANNNGIITANGNFSVVGSSTNLAYANGGLINLSGVTITFSNSPAYSQQTLTATNGGKILAQGITFTNGSTVTGTRYYSEGLSLIDAGTGTPNTTIPGNANGLTALGGVAN